MKSETRVKNPSFVEFVIIISLMTSLTAFSIDAMLPALPEIASELGVKSVNDRQLVVSTLFLGLGFGQLFFGPLSDKIGRKLTAYIGFALFIAGSLGSVFAGSFQVMLAGRLLQGFGISGPRAMTLAVVRDRYEGDEMARVMSFVQTVFILIPMVAPTFGQFVMNLAGWRSIFIALALMGALVLAWFGFRMPETLAPESRAPFTLKRIVESTGEILKNRTALAYTVSAGLVGGAFLGYLNSAQQIFVEQYGLGDRFPFFFAILASSIGLASFLNGRLVMRFGMRSLIRWALRVIMVLALGGLVVALLSGGTPPFWFLMAYLMTTLFSVGILFGNQNAMAMGPLGHLAGIGSAIVGSLSTLIQTPFGTVIGQNYNGTIIPLIIGIIIMIGLSILVVRWAGNED